MDTGKVGRIFVGETEQRLSAPKNDYQLSCALRHKGGEIDPWGRFHQHFTRGFFVRKFCAKLFCT